MKQKKLTKNNKKRWSERIFVYSLRCILELENDTFYIRSTVHAYVLVYDIVHVLLEQNIASIVLKSDFSHYVESIYRFLKESSFVV